ncbi:carboxypeptidase family protein [Luteibacter sp. OK325]|uniref:carboxypeptidase-like regulatory domain-containing protein n=1 Tax=Luteibacter sp. OK325 TaxID=2135670 RepID=UPI000D352839|nr:carboxypeptidase-like regulatory domain-containing protein [Luteibacter sp. OK325]PTR33897.1 carboxypeptidase family protein [Luteibacter sp. OK325]
MKSIGYRAFLLGVATSVAVTLFATAAAPVQAQGTTASMFGQGPAGGVVTAKSDTGAQRHATISDSGRYKISPIPMGTYTVTLEKDGKVLDTRNKISLTVGKGAEVDFACENDKCATGS